MDNHDGSEKSALEIPDILRKTFARIARGDFIALEKKGYWRDMRKINKATKSKYFPHQGKKECARRRRQMGEPEESRIILLN